MGDQVLNNLNVRTSSLFRKLMVWWRIVKPVTFMSSEILVALPFSLGEKVAGKARGMRGTAPNAPLPPGKGPG